MAEALALAGSIVGFLLDVLPPFIASLNEMMRNTAFTKLKDDLEQLRKNVEIFLAVVKENEKKNSKIAKALENRVLTAIEDAEVARDSALSKMAKLDDRGKVSKTKKQVIAKLQEDIQKINEEFKDIQKKFEFLLLSKVPEHSSIRVPTHFREVKPSREKTIIGMKDEAKKLVGMLEEKKEGVAAISIIGMPGLGKTTMASTMFYHPDFNGQCFTQRIWVNVSQDYSMKDISVKILKQLNSENRNWSECTPESLFEEVRERLNLLRFLLVLDDVWEPDAWNEINDNLLPKSSDAQGKVLITSRSKDVAYAANSRLHELRKLNSQESWDLLQLEVYGEDYHDKCPKHLVSLGKDIAIKKGKGLPLALVVTGGYLKLKMDPIQFMEMEWKRVLEGVQVDITGQEHMDNIISLSYDEMPYLLRRCFLCLSVFPEDYEIPVKNLIHLWMAEGFVRQEQPDRSLELEDIAWDYLKRLININLVMLGKRGIRVPVRTIFVHDVILEFCQKKAAAQNLIHVMKKIPEHDNSSYRRISVHSSAHDFIQRNHNFPTLLSFLYITKEGRGETAQIIQEGESDKLIEGIPLVRVLEGSLFKFARFYKGLQQLIYLRYLSFTAGDDFKELPSSISKLEMLQTLVIETSDNTPEIIVDVSIFGLKELRQLKCRSRMTFRKGKKDRQANKNLRTLGRLSTNSCAVLRNIPNLKSLAIDGDLNSVEADCLSNLKSLLNLKITHKAGTHWSRFSSSFFPPMLDSLTLSGTRLNCADIRELGQLGCLRILKLKDSAFEGEHWEIPAAFHSLDYLLIENCNLETLAFSPADSIQRPLTLDLRSCSKFSCVKQPFTKRFQELKMKGLSNVAVEWALALPPLTH